jgi:hypothetical protein
MTPTAGNTAPRVSLSPWVYGIALVYFALHLAMSTRYDDFFGPQYGLPKAISGHQNYFLWGPRQYTGNIMILMGTRRRSVPKLLAKKLLRIRQHLGIGQVEMARRLKHVPGAPGDGAAVSRFERGEREPNLLVVVAYANLAGIVIDPIVDDRWDMDLFELALSGESVDKIAKKKKRLD